MHRLRLAAAAVVLVAATGCQVTLGVGVDAHGDGTGRVQATVTLDKEAATKLAAFGPPKVDDLKKAGWVIEGPIAGASGTTLYRATKTYRTPGEVAGIVAQLSGPTGPFQSFRVVRHRSLFETRTSFSGAVDLKRGVDSFGDPSLAAVTGSALGVDAAALRTRLNADLNRILGVQVSTRLPGSLTGSNAPAPVGNGAVWKPKFGELAQLSASSRQWNTRRIAAAAGLVVAVLLMVALAIRRRFAARHRLTSPRSGPVRTVLALGGVRAGRRGRGAGVPPCRRSPCAAGRAAEQKRQTVFWPG